VSGSVVIGAHTMLRIMVDDVALLEHGQTDGTDLVLHSFRYRVAQW